jgi:hypothetical protein
MMFQVFFQAQLNKAKISHELVTNNPTTVSSSNRSTLHTGMSSASAANLAKVSSSASLI